MRCPAVPSKSIKPILFAVDIVTIVGVPNGIRPLTATSLATCGEGGTMKSAALVAVPDGVAIVRRPDPVVAGTVAVRDVVVAADTLVTPRLIFKRLFAGVVSKFVPLTVTGVPATPMAGVKLVIVGAVAAVTVNTVGLVADPAGAVTVMAPIVAPEGTVTTRLTADAG